MDEAETVLKILIIDGVKVMEFQHILADVKPEILVELGAQGFQQAIPSCLVASRALIYLDSACQRDGPLNRPHKRDCEWISRLTTKPQIESLNFVHVILDLIWSMSTSGSDKKPR